MTDPYVKLNIEEQIGYIEFFHPAHNSLTGKILGELAQIITEAGPNRHGCQFILVGGMGSGKRIIYEYL